MRRILAGAGAGLALLLAAPLAAHADTVPAAWSNSKSTTDTSVSSGTFDITAEFRRAHPFLSSTQFSVHTYLTIPSGLASGCGSAGDKREITTTGDEVSDGVYLSSASAAVTCNGRYPILIDGQMINKGNKKPIDPGAQLDPTVEVKMRPANVPSAHAAFGDGKVAISWDAVEDKTPDFLGYQVQIAKDDSWVTVDDGETQRDSTFLLVDAPAAGTDAVYRVRARRDGPDGDVYSADAAETDKVTIPTTSTTTPGSPPATNPDGTPNPGGGTGGSTGTGGTAGPGTGSGSGSTPHKGRSFDPLTPGIVGVGTKAPRVGIPVTGNVSGLLTDPDSGYADTLDYGDQQLAGGEDDSDGLSSFTYEDGGNGRGMAVPVATGLVLAAWAFHFRYLARAAKPAKKRRPVQPRGGWA
jgi:hypothetical protein